MPAVKPITIVGGGLAGLTLGIGLRQREVPVTLWEARRYPHHRVCGEFISGRGQHVLERFSLVEPLLKAGAIWASTAAFFFGQSQSALLPLPTPALCLSRFRMDALLADLFRSQGGDLREGQRWRESDFGPGTVRATGRRVQPVEKGWRWVGLKVHARNVLLLADLELHVMPNGYVGLCRLAGDTVNVCGLFRRPAEARDWQPWENLLGAAAGAPLATRLAGAVIEEGSSCSVAGLALGPCRAVARTECCLGDALTMIPPVTGNGMSMALEAADLALDPLTAYSRGSLTWEQVKGTLAKSCDQAFARRLAWARWLQTVLLAPVVRSGLGALSLRSEWLWNIFFSATR